MRLKDIIHLGVSATMAAVAFYWVGGLPVSAEPVAAVAMDVSAQRERLSWLRAEIARHDELYFKKNAPEISDAEYDRLKRELVVLQKAFPDDVTAGGKKSKAGDDRSGEFTTHRHREAMLSLEKAYEESELRAFMARSERALRQENLVYVVEPKFDGLAVSLTYERGRLVRAVTRGDGSEGDDVTANVSMIAGVSRELRTEGEGGAKNPIPEVVELRGEIYLTLAEFARINAEREAGGEEPFAHPRNLAAGTLKQKDAALVAQRGLSLAVYGWGAWEGGAGEPGSQQAFHGLVRAWGLPGVEGAAVARDADETWAVIERWGAQRSTLAFPADGVVVKIDSRVWQRELGAGEEAPRWAVAYKFPPERVVTRLNGITLQIGRTGVLTPVAELEPVKIGGTVIARATLHNVEEIARRDLRVGDFVYVERAGEVIPAIVGVELERRGAEVVKFEPPEKCPSCGAALVREAKDVKCGNARCPAQVRKRVEFFVSKEGVGIRGMGPALIERLVSEGKVAGVADVYGLKKEDVSERVWAEIERSRTVELEKVLAGLGVGKKRAAELMAKHEDLRGMAEELGGEAGALVEAGVNPPGLREKK